MLHFISLLPSFFPQHQNCILLLFYYSSRFLFTSFKVLWLDHWELIFPFTNTNWDTEESYLKHIFNVSTVIIFLVCYFKLNSVAFSYRSLFLNHLFTSIYSFLSCKCLHNPLLCCIISLYKPLHLGRCNAMTTACSGSLFLVWHLPYCTSITHFWICDYYFILGVGSIQHTVKWVSPKLLQRPLQYKWNMVCLSVA